MTVHQDLSQAGNSALLAEIDGLRARLALANKPRKLTLKVSAQGAVSVYGMGRWPVTLYRQQWERVLGSAQEIHDFIAANVEHLSVKE